MKHALFGKIALVAGITCLIGAGGSAAFGFQPDLFFWDFTNKKSLSFEDAETTTKTVDLDGAQTAHVDVQLGAGEMNLSGGAQPSLMSGKFSYIKELEPEVNYERQGDEGHLQIKQSKPTFKTRLGSNASYRWNAQLNNDVPLDLNVDTGAGENVLHLGDIKLQHLYVNMGAGETMMDLRGDWEQGFDADIDTGIGETTVLLPKETGVNINVDKGIGEISTKGLFEEDGHYRNRAYEGSADAINMDLDMGVGEVILKVVQ